MCYPDEEVSGVFLVKFVDDCRCVGGVHEVVHPQRLQVDGQGRVVSRPQEQLGARVEADGLILHPGADRPQERS